MAQALSKGNTCAFSVEGFKITVQDKLLLLTCRTDETRRAKECYTVPSFLVPRKVRFLAMTMFEQVRHCSFGLTKTFLLDPAIPYFLPLSWLSYF